MALIDEGRAIMEKIQDTLTSILKSEARLDFLAGDLNRLVEEHEKKLLTLRERADLPSSTLAPGSEYELALREIVACDVKKLDELRDQIYSACKGEVIEVDKWKGEVYPVLKGRILGFMSMWSPLSMSSTSRSQV